MIKATDIDKIANDSLRLKQWEISNLDSYTLLELVMNVERYYDIIFEAEELEGLKSKNDLAALVNEKLQKQK